MTKKVVFIDTVHPVLWERLSEAGYTCVDATNLKKEECVAQVTDATGLVIRSRFPMDEEFLSHAKTLKFIARSGAGMENIDIPYCEKRGIVLHNAPEGNRNAVAEHALGMLLALFNNLKKGDSEIRAGVWDREGNRGVELDGKTVGIIGYGNNGAAFAKKLRGFDVEVLAYDKYKTGFGDAFVKVSSLAEIQQKADVLSLHIPQNEETKFWMDTPFFNAFQKAFYLINLSRGKIVKTSGLRKALNEGKILGACLDVLEYEKASFENIFSGEMPDDFKFLLNSDKVLLSPHVGGWTHESYFKLSDVLADKILAQG
ncbi:D-3-phosphoglycerate dehydrogenase [Lishizhenia tianjinensis]|uniref:D-3-phosphoglycerate dehydrogenase n=1 Tax=Lishizhenia tianjinensis TaxID=477690 RepID=A0A1I6ZVL9_9FLAO|nr:2-hydroxyacid dehydrogenase [Lishizhenia tianjinensis]SFT66770.1 D-3-phosphoglycerate dehydrogenase [Lishizhenia tianjinensis]